MGWVLAAFAIQLVAVLSRGGVRGAPEAVELVAGLRYALHLSPLTVKTHVSRILAKLRARDRVQLVVIAYQTGLVSPRRTKSAR